MKLPRASYPKTKLSSLSRLYVYMFAAILIAMVTAQLISFEKFGPIIENYQLPGAEATSKTVSGIIVVSEVLALPFLLRMELSRLMRLLSATALVAASLTWLGLGIWVIYLQPPLISSGVFGAFLPAFSHQLATVVGSLLTLASIGLFLTTRDAE